MKNKIAHSLATKVIGNGGRWCEITIKATGEIFRVIRTGYRSFEDALYDSFNLVDESGKVVESGDNLFEIAEWIRKRYC